MSILISKKFTFDEHDAPLYSLEEVGDNSFFSGGGDRLVTLREAAENAIPKAIVNTGSTIYSLKYVADRNLLFVGVSGGGMHVIDLVQKKEIHFLVNHSNGIFDIQHCPARKIIVTCGGDGTISIWSVEDYSLLKSFRLCESKVRSAAISHDDKIAAVGCGDGTIRIIDLSALEEIQSIKAHSQSVNVVAFHPIQNLLLSGGKDAILNIWDKSGYIRLDSIPAHNYSIYSISFEKSGSFMATGSRDKTVKIWNAENMNFISRIDKEKNQGHSFSVNKVLWLKDVLISAGDDKKIIGWTIKRN